jgi:ketosteroid isomerase-like protein
MNTERVLRFPKIGLVILTLILLAVSGFALLISVAWPLIRVPSSPAPIQADPLQVVNGLHSAINNNDVDAFLNLFADDAVVHDDGTVIKGKEQIRNWALHSERMFGVRLTLLHAQVVGEKVFWNDLAQNGLAGQNRPYILRWIVVIQKGKIQSLTVSLLPMPDGK